MQVPKSGGSLQETPPFGPKFKEPSSLDAAQLVILCSYAGGVLCPSHSNKQEDYPFSMLHCRSFNTFACSNKQLVTTDSSRARCGASLHRIRSFQATPNLCDAQSELNAFQISFCDRNKVRAVLAAALSSFRSWFAALAYKYVTEGCRIETHRYGEETGASELRLEVCSLRRGVLYKVVHSGYFSIDTRALLSDTKSALCRHFSYNNNNNNNFAVGYAIRRVQVNQDGLKLNGTH